MTAAADRRPAWINIDALTTPDEIARRHELAAQAHRLLPALFDWIREAAPLAEWPDLELEGRAGDLIHAAMGIAELDEMRFLLGELVRVFEAPTSELTHRFASIERAYPEFVGSEVGRR